MADAILAKSRNEVLGGPRGTVGVGPLGRATVERGAIDETTREVGFDAALAMIVGAGLPPGVKTAGAAEADARALAAQRTVKCTGKATGAKDEAAREVKQAALVDVAQVAADKLANPAAPGAVAEADEEQVSEGAGQQIDRPSGREQPRSERGETVARGVTSQQRGAEGSATAGHGDVHGGGAASKQASQASASVRGAEQGDSNLPDANQARAAAATSKVGLEAVAVASTASAAGGTGQHGNAAGATSSNSVAIGGVQGARSAAFKKLLEQGQPARRATEQQQVAQSVAKSLQMLVKEGGGEVVLKLRPGELGAVSARLTIQDARVEATFRAQTEVARDLLVKSVDDLRAALETRGLVVDRIDVRLDTPPEDSAVRGHDQSDSRVKLAGSERTREEGVGNAEQDGGSQGRDSQGSTDSRSGNDGRRGEMARMPMERAAAFADAPVVHADDAGVMDEQAWSLAGAGGRVLDGFEWVA